jgi:two-component system phosphate regulon sensor histidine kinase PhoR
MRRILFLQAVGSALVIVLVAISLFAMFFLRFVRDASRAEVIARLGATALAVRAVVAPADAAGDAAGVRATVASLASATGARLTVIASDGTVIADSEQDPATMENHRQRPEVAAALEGRVASVVRFSSTLGRNLVYVAQPPATPGGAVVRASSPEEAIDELAAPARQQVALFAAIALVAGLAVALVFSRQLTHPITLITDVVRRVAGGDFGARLHLRGGGEVKELAESVNSMAERLKRQFDALAASSRELDALFTAVQAGIAMLDADGRVARFNPALSRLSGMSDPSNRSVWELTRDPGLAEAVRRTRESGAPAVLEVGRAGRVLLASVFPMDPGSVLVLQDVTDARRLEDTKRELVANVSHELRTPLTAIQGFLEMLEGEVEGEAARAVEVIGRNVRRMSAIVEDLLVLSRLESSGVLHASEVDVSAVAADVARLYEPRARAKGLALTVSAPPDAGPLVADPHLVEQLLVNLVDNAVRYTEHGGITIGASREEGELALWVEDTGIGIAEEHLGRIFERFYVVDPARSRQLGGTGLGLAIVKHIALLHGGRVDVSSRTGQGSRFTVRLPLHRK